MDVNLLGSVFATRACLPYMKKQNQGRIVFISSQAGQLGLFGYTAYCSSKFAVRGFAEALQMEVGSNHPARDVVLKKGTGAILFWLYLPKVGK